MNRALEIIKEHGSIVRYPGGFWHKPDAPLKYSGGLPSQSFYYPEGYIGTNTLNSLLNRELIEVAEEVNGPRGKFAVKYILK